MSMVSLYAVWIIWPTGKSETGEALTQGQPRVLIFKPERKRDWTVERI